jgi:hypothetical protein
MKAVRLSTLTGSQSPAWEPSSAKLCFAPREAGASLKNVPKRELGNEKRELANEKRELGTEKHLELGNEGKRHLERSEASRRIL